jgi:hypothetical protein
VCANSTGAYGALGVEEDLGGVRPFMDMDLGLDGDKEEGGEWEGCLKMMVRSAGRADVSTSIVRALDDMQGLAGGADELDDVPILGICLI